MISTRLIFGLSKSSDKGHLPHAACSYDKRLPPSFLKWLIMNITILCRKDLQCLTVVYITIKWLIYFLYIFPFFLCYTGGISKYNSVLSKDINRCIHKVNNILSTLFFLLIAQWLKCEQTIIENFRKIGRNKYSFSMFLLITLKNVNNYQNKNYRWVRSTEFCYLRLFIHT